MFKGFGNKQEPSIKDVVRNGLKAYGELQEIAKGDSQAERLLAQVVMKYRCESGDSERSEEAKMSFARIKTACALETIEKASEQQYSLVTLLTVALHVSDEQLMAWAV